MPGGGYGGGGDRRDRRRGEGARPFPTTWDRRPPTAAKEAMSVTSDNYARVPVAIGLLILLGARWVRSLLAPQTCRSHPCTTRPGVRLWLVAVVDGSELFVGGVGSSGAILRPIGRP